MYLFLLHEFWSAQKEFCIWENYKNIERTSYEKLLNAKFQRKNTKLKHLLIDLGISQQELLYRYLMSLLKNHKSDRRG